MIKIANLEEKIKYPDEPKEEISAPAYLNEDENIPLLDEQNKKRLETSIPKCFSNVFSKLTRGHIISNEEPALLDDLEKYRASYACLFDRFGFILERSEPFGMATYACFSGDDTSEADSVSNARKRDIVCVAMCVCISLFLIGRTSVPPFRGEEFSIADLERWCNQKSDILSIFSKYADEFEKKSSSVVSGLAKMETSGYIKIDRSTSTVVVRTPFARLFSEIQSDFHRVESLVTNRCDVEEESNFVDIRMEDDE